MRRILLVAQWSRLGEIAHVEPLEIGQLVDDGQPSERFQVGVDSRWGAVEDADCRHTEIRRLARHGAATGDDDVD